MDMPCIIRWQYNEVDCQVQCHPNSAACRSVNSAGKVPGGIPNSKVSMSPQKGEL